MGSTYKVLGQANPLAGVVTDLYEVPGSAMAVASTFSVCNRGTNVGSQVAFGAGVAPGGETDNAKHYFAYDAPIGSKETIAYTMGITMDGGDVFRVYSVSGGLSFSLWGEEIEP